MDSIRKSYGPDFNGNELAKKSPYSFIRHKKSFYNNFTNDKK